MAFGGGWTLGVMTGPDRTVHAASHKIVHVGPTRGCALWWYRHNGAPLWEPQMSHEWQSLQKRPGPASAGTLFFIAVELGRQRYSRVPKSVLVSPAPRRLVHGATRSQNSAAFHLYFLRHHITVNW